MSKEQEFKALLNIASYDLKTMEQICETIEKALYENPEWSVYLFMKKFQK